jgi:hypothetical protein
VATPSLSLNISIGFIMNTFSRILLSMVLAVSFTLVILWIAENTSTSSQQGIYDPSLSDATFPESD